MSFGTIEGKFGDYYITFVYSNKNGVIIERTVARKKKYIPRKLQQLYWYISMYIKFCKHMYSKKFKNK